MSAGLFCLGLVPGIIATVAFLISGSFFFYLWRVVLAFYKDSSQTDEGGIVYQKTSFLPTAPQQFDMVER